jgi:hypothetical protein
MRQDEGNMCRMIGKSYFWGTRKEDWDQNLKNIFYSFVQNSSLNCMQAFV